MDITLQKSQPLQKFHREALYPLFEQVFNISPLILQDYYNRGFWNPDYCAYTLFQECNAIANVSVVPINWMISGELITAAGIQSVMTLPPERRKGYMKKLMNGVLEDLQDKYSLIFLQTDSPKLYEKYGFTCVEEQFFTTNAYENSSLRALYLRKLDYKNDLDAALIQSCFAYQHPNSQVFTPLNYKHSLYLNLYNPSLASMLFYCESLQALLVYEVSERVLKIYDVIGKHALTLVEICDSIPEPFSSVELYFTPDGLINLSQLQTKRKEGTLMVKGKLELGQQAVAFPITASF